MRGAVLGDETAVAMAGSNTSSLQRMAYWGGAQAGGCFNLITNTQLCVCVCVRVFRCVLVLTGFHRRCPVNITISCGDVFDWRGCVRGGGACEKLGVLLDSRSTWAGMA